MSFTHRLNWLTWLQFSLRDLIGSTGCVIFLNRCSYGLILCVGMAAISPLFVGVAVVYSCLPPCLFGFVLGFLARIALSFGCFLFFACFGYFDHRCHFQYFDCSGFCFLIGISCGGPCCHRFHIPILDPTGGVCRRRVSRFIRGPIWQMSPYGRNHIVAARHCKVSTYFRSRPSRTVVTPLGSYSFCGSRGVRSVCRADHRDPHPNSKVCPYETAIYGVLMSS